jgi:hypothetical protein
MTKNFNFQFQNWQEFTADPPFDDWPALDWSTPAAISCRQPLPYLEAIRQAMIGVHVTINWFPWGQNSDALAAKVRSLLPEVWWRPLFPGFYHIRQCGYKRYLHSFSDYPGKISTSLPSWKHNILATLSNDEINWNTQTLAEWQALIVNQGLGHFWHLPNRLFRARIAIESLRVANITLSKSPAAIPLTDPATGNETVYEFVGHQSLAIDACKVYYGDWEQPLGDLALPYVHWLPGGGVLPALYSFTQLPEDERDINNFCTTWGCWKNNDDPHWRFRAIPTLALTAPPINNMSMATDYTALVPLKYPPWTGQPLPHPDSYINDWLTLPCGGAYTSPPMFEQSATWPDGDQAGWYEKSAVGFVYKIDDPTWPFCMYRDISPPA